MYENLPDDYYSKQDNMLPKNITEKHSYFLNKAAHLATKSVMSHRHGCVIVYNDNILAEGWNKTQTHYSHSFSLHAEVDAIYKCQRKYKDIFSDVEMYIVRIGPASMDNCFKYSKPCENCTKVIERFRIGKVYYSTNYDFEDKIKTRYNINVNN